jgi:hypothetical protein
VRLTPHGRAASSAWPSEHEQWIVELFDGLDLPPCSACTSTWASCACASSSTGIRNAREALMSTAHVDTFARDNLPPREQQPEYLFDLPELAFPAQLNCATELLDRRVAEGGGERPCISRPTARAGRTRTPRQRQRIANVLVREMGVVPGNRVLLRAPNNPMMAACWFAVMKAGAIAVATMPLLRAKELAPSSTRPRSRTRCATRASPTSSRRAQRRRRRCAVALFNDASAGRLEAAMAGSRRLRERRHGRGRHLHPRLHVGHHRRAEGDDALSIAT